MTNVLQTKASLVWLVLVALTTISWMLGSQPDIDGVQHASASLVIFLVAVFKVRLIGLHFMELRDAPWALRGIFEAYCAALILLLCGMYLFG